MLSNTHTRDVEAVLHPFTNLVTHRKTGPVVFERGKGVFVYDDKGKDYIEGMAGLWCTALGWGEEALVQAAAEQMRKLAYEHLFAGRSNEPCVALAEKLKEISPFPAGRVFFCNSGSEANDTQVKLFWYINHALGKPQKRKFISRTKAYHGVTVAAASLTGLPALHKSFGLPLDFVKFADCPHYYRNAEPGESEEDFSARMAANLEALIAREGADTIAAMIAEPLQGAGGVILPPRGYFPAIQKVLARHGIPLIDDEVICGFARTGEMFGAETWHMKPVSMTVAKALSSAYLPISALVVAPELCDIIEEESGKVGTFGHGYTYTGHPVSAAVALKTIELYQERDILGHVRKVAPHFQRRLKKLEEHPLIADANGVGLIGGIEIVKDKKSKAQFDHAKGVAAAFAKFAEHEGVISRPLLGDRIALCPPLIITEGEIDELFNRFERGLAHGLDWVKKEGLLG